MGLNNCYLLLNKNSNKCLDVFDSAANDGAKLQQWRRNDGDNQLWEFVPVDHDYFLIISRCSKTCIDDAYSSHSNGSPIHLWSKHSENNQQWKLQQTDDGYFLIVSKIGGLCIDATYDTSNGASVHLWSIHHGDNQKWKIIDPTSEHMFEPSKIFYLQTIETASTNYLSDDIHLKILSVQLATKFTLDHNMLNEAIIQYSKSITSAAFRNGGELKNTDVKQLKGFIAEAHHVQSYNIDAAAKRIPERVNRVRLTKYGAPSRDYEFYGDNARGGGQIKYRSTPKQTANDLSLLNRDLTQKYPEEKVAPSEQVQEIKAFSQKKSGLTQDTRPEVSKAHQHTKENVKSIIHNEELGITGDPLSNSKSQSLTKNVKDGKEVKYVQASEKRTKQYLDASKDAVKIGFISGTITSTVGEIVSFCRSGRQLTQEEFAQGVTRILISGADGAARSVTLVTAQKMFAKGITSTLKSNVITTSAIVLYDFTKDLYQFCMGTKSGDELLSDTISNSLQTTGVVAGGALGSSIATAIGIGATIGTPLGPLGVVVGATIGGLIVGLGVDKIVSSAKQEGSNRLKEDLEQLNYLSGNNSSIYKYIDVLSEMHDYKFSFKHLVPCYGTLGALSEYSARKKALDNIHEQLRDQKTNLINDYNKGLRELEKSNKEACLELEKKFSEHRIHQLEDTKDYLQQLSDDVTGYFKSQAILVWTSSTNTIDEMNKIQYNRLSVNKNMSELVEVQNILYELTKTADLISDQDNRESLLRFIRSITSEKLFKDYIPPIRRSTNFFLSD